jgi:hypothetical protein
LVTWWLMMVHSKICQSCILQRADYFHALAAYLETLGFIEVQDIPFGWQLATDAWLLTALQRGTCRI